jgi:hypothetical protein
MPKYVAREFGKDNSANPAKEIVKMTAITAITIFPMTLLLAQLIRINRNSSRYYRRMRAAGSPVDSYLDIPQARKLRY